MPFKDPEVGKKYKQAYYRRHKAHLLAYARSWYKKNRKKRLAYQKAYTLKHLEKCRAGCRKRSREEKNLARARKWHKDNRARGKASTARWQALNKDKTAAHSKVGYALKTGKLVRKPCEVCGAKKVDAHHEDYTKPLKVRWLCCKHHKLLHRKYA